MQEVVQLQRSACCRASSITQSAPSSLGQQIALAAHLWHRVCIGCPGRDGLLCVLGG